MSRPGDELTELLWDNGPALRTTQPHCFPPAPFFQPFTCSAAGSSRAHELDKQRHALVGAIMDDDDDVGLPVHPHQHHEEEDAVPWLHCPVIDDADSDTAPLPPEYCESLLSSGYSESLHAEPEPAAADPPIAPCTAPPPPSSNAVGVPATQPQPSESIMNFTFFSRHLQQRPQPCAATAAAASQSNPLESTVVQQTMESRLRSTPLFSEQRMAWFQPPTKPPRAAGVGAAASPAATHATPATEHHRRPRADATPATLTVTQHRVRPDATAAAAVTTSSVCSANGDRPQSHHTKRSSGEQLAAECSVSQDEDVDHEPGAARRSAARGTKRSRTAEVHNLSERRRRDRINEKMRALQELIPNCNKVDKASMLEEAIEYLKTLQLQVQMMSMGAGGLCMAPSPAAAAMLMQMQVPPFAAYPHHLGMQMQMSMGAAAFAGAAQFPCPMPMVPGALPPTMAMPHGSTVFGQVMPPPFLHHMNGGGSAPAEQGGAAAAVSVAAPAGGAVAGTGDRPPVPVAPPQGDHHQKLEHPKQT